MTSKKKSVIVATCVICNSKITHTVVFRKCCRTGNCRELFCQMKKCWLKNNTSNLTDDELKLYKKLIMKGAFNIRKYKKRDNDMSRIILY